MIGRRKLRWLALNLFAAVPVFAQPAASRNVTEELAQTAKTTLQDPSLSSAFSSALSQVSLVSSGDATSLRAEAGFDFGTFWSLGLRVETKIEEGSSKADLVNFDGLTGGSKATFTATRIIMGADFDEFGLAEVCRGYNAAMDPQRQHPMPVGAAGCASLLTTPGSPAFNARVAAIETKALQTICSDYNLDGGFIDAADCQTVARAEQVLPAAWVKRLRKKIVEAGAPICVESCAARFADRVASWQKLRSAAEANGTKLKDIEEAQAKIDEAWDLRMQTAEQDALTAICADYNKTGADPPIFPMDCRDALSVKQKLPDDLDEKLDEKIVELQAKVCEEYNAMQPASWGFLTVGGSDCTFSSLETRGDAWAYDAVRATKFSPTIVSFSVAADRQDFEFIEIGAHDPEIPLEDELDEPTEQSKFGFAFTTAAGKLFFLKPLRPLYFGGGLSLSRAFKGGAAKQVCRPSDTAGVTLCEEIVTAAPSEENRKTIHLEARYFPFKRLGLVPRLAYEFEQGIATSQLTAFFLTHETKGLNGGIDLAYRDDGKGFVARLFIGASFSILP